MTIKTTSVTITKYEVDGIQYNTLKEATVADLKLQFLGSLPPHCYASLVGQYIYDNYDRVLECIMAHKKCVAFVDYDTAHQDDTALFDNKDTIINKDICEENFIAINRRAYGVHSWSGLLDAVDNLLFTGNKIHAIALVRECIRKYVTVDDTVAWIDARRAALQKQEQK